MKSLCAMACALVVLVCTGASLGQTVSVNRNATATSDRSENRCARECSAKAKQLVSECIAAGNAESDCLAKGLEFERNCRRHCTQPASCEEKCQALARSVHEQCIEAGGAAEACDLAARQALQACLSTHCLVDRCEDRCASLALDAYRQCVAYNAADVDCATRARMMYNNCIDEHCEPVPCEERCRDQAVMVRRICLEAGGSQDQCDHPAREFLAACLENHCRPSDCEDSCVDRATNRYRECVESGVDPDQCAVRARHFLGVCLEEHCQPSPLTCEERCQRYARNVHAMCIELGGSPHNCEARAQEALQACLAEHCTEPTCEERCRRLAHYAFEQCLAAGVSEEECAARAASIFEECVRTNCGAQCGGIAGLACPDGAVCIFPPGTCDVADHMGICMPLPDACPDIYEPVCGCDGMTYGNACAAVRAGASLDHAGPCGQACGGIAGLPCLEGQFCKFRAGTCEILDNMGICAAIPQTCPDIYRPVCGCDGNTYGNPCEADMAQMAIAYEGECRQECGGIIGVPCDKGEFCHFPPGTCDVSDNMGWCVPLPPGCPDVWEPVCGCDGVTYANKCDAAAAGVSIDHEGPCRVACQAGNACGKVQFCAFPLGACGEGQGECREIPHACPEVFDPVCGCDGHTYPNRCFAAKAAMSIKHEGPCEALACSSNETCAQGQWCRFATGACGGDGHCLPRPDACPLYFMPVCGCDGNTYGNECDAASAGVSVRHAGSCQD